MLKWHHFCSEADPSVSNNYKKEEEKNQTIEKKNKQKGGGGSLAQIIISFSNFCGLAVEIKKKINPAKYPNPPVASPCPALPGKGQG